MFEAATNREEYYKLLAQKIYHIRKELEDRKNQKKPVGNKGTCMCKRVYSWCSGLCYILYLYMYVCVLVASKLCPSLSLSLFPAPPPLSLPRPPPAQMPGMVNGDPNIQQPNFPYFGGGSEPGPAGGASPASSLAPVSGAAGGQFNPASLGSPHQPPLSGTLDLPAPGSVNATNFSPRPVGSVENKQDIKQKLFSPQSQGSSDPLHQSGTLKSEPLSPSPATFGSGPTSIPNPPQSQSVKSELSNDVSSTLNIPDMPPLPESLPSVPNTHTPAPGKLLYCHIDLCHHNIHVNGHLCCTCMYYAGKHSIVMVRCTCKYIDCNGLMLF